MAQKLIAGFLLVMFAGTVFAAPPVMPAAQVHYHWAPTAFHAEPCTRTDCDRTTVWQPGGSNPQKISDTDGDWVAFPPPSHNAEREAHACTYDIAHNMVYMIGGDTAGISGVPFCQRFDPVTNTWTELADMPDGRMWIDGEGSYCQHLEKIYIAGGYSISGANNNMWEYDIATNTWSEKAPMPYATVAYMSGIWNDSLIYICGGSGPGLGGSNVVQVYNVNRNTWTTATPMPEAGDMGSGTIVGDTIYITNAYNRQMGSVWPNARKGAINPANPLQITWSNWTEVPTLGFCGATTQCRGWIYRLGGFLTPYGPVHSRGWRYNVSTGVYETLPWLPGPPNTGVARCNFLTHSDASYEIFKLAGYANPYYYRNQFSPTHDVGVSKIVAPASPKLEIGVPITPRVRVKNYGLNPEANFPVAFRVDSAGTIIYEDALLFTDTILPDEEVEVTFTSDWTPNCDLWSGYTVYAFTLMTGDVIPQNDTCRMSTIHTGDTVCSYRSNNPPSLDGYLEPGEWDDACYVSFPNVFGWRGAPYPLNAAQAWFKHDENYLYAAFALPLDVTRNRNEAILFYLDENNDGQWATDSSEGTYWYWVTVSGTDEVLFWPITPSGRVNPDVAPGAQVVTSVFNGYLVFETKTPFGVLPYQLNMNPAGDTGRLFFYAYTNSKYYGWWPADMPADSILNPCLYGTLILQMRPNGVVDMSPLFPAVSRGLQIYPNPCRGVVNVKLEEGEGLVKLWRMDGALMKSERVRNGGAVYRLNLRGVPSGVYVLEAGSGVNRKREKLVVE